MLNEVWISVEEVCSLTGEIKETVRRKCKSNKYISKYVKNGKFKIYSVLLSSLPSSAQNKYLNINNKWQDNTMLLEKNEQSYSNSLEVLLSLFEFSLLLLAISLLFCKFPFHVYSPVIIRHIEKDTA